MGYWNLTRQSFASSCAVALIQVDTVQTIRLCGGQKAQQIHVVDMDGFFRFVPGACSGFAEPDALGVSGAPQGMDLPGKLDQLLRIRLPGPKG